MNHSPASQSFFLKLAVLAAYTGAFYFLIISVWWFAWFAVGVLCAVTLLVADEQTLCAWYRDKETETFLVTRSPLFLLALIPLSLFVFTSSNSYWASGLVGGMFLFLLLEMTELRRKPAEFSRRFLQGTTVVPSASAVMQMVLVGWAAFLAVHVLTIL
jgi:hypothetical protein